MTTTPTSPDPTMEAIGRAVTEGRNGDADSARRQLLELWDRIGESGDPLHRCALAHYLADLYEDLAQALVWDTRALAAADSQTDDRAREHHAGLQVAGFYPSPHLSLADNHRRLGDFAVAAEHIGAARAHAPNLPEGPYGDFLRGAIDEVVAAKDTERRASAPGAAG